MLEEFKRYYEKAGLVQGHLYEGKKITREDVNDDLCWFVPIYDVINRKYAAFSGFPEAIKQKEKDPKGNGELFSHCNISEEDFIHLLYLFRLCGSGITYNPKSNNTEKHPIGTHGFGNFWIVQSLLNGRDKYSQWIEDLPEKGFCDCKGYLLPMISKGMRNFILEDSKDLVECIILYAKGYLGTAGIKDVVDFGNNILRQKGFKRQNFVLTAFAMDLAEYFPNLVDPNSDTYVGTQAKKCLKLITPGMKDDDALRMLCDITGNRSKPYDMEDVACDFIRYINNFQSPEHIENNNGITYKNNVGEQAKMRLQ